MSLFGHQPLDESLYTAFHLLDADGIPRMSIYAHLADTYHLHEDAVRKIIRQQTKTKNREFVRVA